MQEAKRNRVTLARLKELLAYDPETGVFTRRIATANVAAGSIAGCAKRAYVMISIDGRLYRAHHLAWLYMTGEWPTHYIDHRDMDKRNNAWRNLRAASKSENGANRPAQANNRSQLKGAYFYKASGRWQSTIQKNGRTIYLGYFDSAEDAHAAYCTAASEIYGEFARAS
jgi:hypothetical protein